MATEINKQYVEEKTMSDENENLSMYSEYNKTLRTWLVGFGFGVPALFIVNNAAQEKLISSDNAETIIWLFLAGAASQVFMAFLNKIVSWCAYYKHSDSKTEEYKIILFFASLEDWFVIDVVFDIFSLIMFGWSIILIMSLFINA